jgi:hypothetical protein
LALRRQPWDFSPGIGSFTQRASVCQLNKLDVLFQGKASTCLRMVSCKMKTNRTKRYFYFYFGDEQNVIGGDGLTA